MNVVRAWTGNRANKNSANHSAHLSKATNVHTKTRGHWYISSLFIEVFS